MGWFSADVETNVKRGSVASCSSVGIVPVIFKELWFNYEDGDPPYQINGKPPKGFENQCAIRMSVTLHKLGVKMLTFSSKYIKPERNEASIGRIELNGKATATRANEFAQWLNTRPICGIGPAENITGEDWKKKIEGRTVEEIRSNREQFQLEILNLQIREESTLDVNKIAFLDRALPDAMAYYEFLGLKYDDRLIAMCKKFCYQKVFLNLKILYYSEQSLYLIL